MNKKIENSNLSYNKMQVEYSKLFTPQINNYLNDLNTIISSIEINGFGMPLIVQNQLYSTLLEVKQILHILSINKPFNTNNHIHSNNPLSLLLSLNTLSQQLNQHALKSPFYTLLNKSNNLILNCTNKILNYFLNNIN